MPSFHMIPSKTIIERKHHPAFYLNDIEFGSQKGKRNARMAQTVFFSKQSLFQLAEFATLLIHRYRFRQFWIACSAMHGIGLSHEPFLPGTHEDLW